MIELHTHTVYSDGKLLPSSLARRAQVLEYRALVLSDHADCTNFDWILGQQSQGLKSLGMFSGLDLFLGLELTHVPPPLMEDVAHAARAAGAQILLAHGESLADTVAPGTNLAAIEAGVDILAHPGLMSLEDACAAAERGVLLEISCRAGHCLSNGHVLKMARKAGAEVVLGGDVHSAKDLTTRQQRRCIALGAGMSEEEVLGAERAADNLVQRLLV